jgi:pimeloyl-ACP methyl ester carboxylesterase
VAAQAGDALAELAERFDPQRIDVPGGAARIRLVVEGGRSYDAVVSGGTLRLGAAARAEPDALLSADPATWERVAADPRGGMQAFGDDRLRVRRNLHLGVGFLAAVDRANGAGRLRFGEVTTRAGRVALMEAGTGPPLLAVHGLGATKAAFCPTLHLLHDSHRVIAVDLPGFGESAKPLWAPYDAGWFAGVLCDVLDGLGLERAAVLGNSLGGRIAIELGLRHPERVRALALLSAACARFGGPWALLLKALRPQLGFLQPAPRVLVEAIARRVLPGAGEDGWRSSAADELIRTYVSPRGRTALYAAVRGVLLDTPAVFWARLATLAPPALFVWGRDDPLVPIATKRRVERALPASRHVVLDCGHVPQIERYEETHAALRRFLGGAGVQTYGFAPAGPDRTQAQEEEGS